MNSVDRQSLANTFAVLLFLLLVYALAGDMDCASDRRVEQARPPASCEMTVDRAGTFDFEHSRQSSDPDRRCPANES